MHIPIRCVQHNQASDGDVKLGRLLGEKFQELQMYSLTHTILVSLKETFSHRHRDLSIPSFSSWYLIVTDEVNINIKFG